MKNKLYILIVLLIAAISARGQDYSMPPRFVKTRTTAAARIEAAGSCSPPAEGLGVVTHRWFVPCQTIFISDLWRHERDVEKKLNCMEIKLQDYATSPAGDVAREKNMTKFHGMEWTVLQRYISGISTVSARKITGITNAGKREKRCQNSIKIFSSLPPPPWFVSSRNMEKKMK